MREPCHGAAASPAAAGRGVPFCLRGRTICTDSEDVRVHVGWAVGGQYSVRGVAVGPRGVGEEECGLSASIRSPLSRVNIAQKKSSRRGEAGSGLAAAPRRGPRNEVEVLVKSGEIRAGGVAHLKGGRFRMPASGNLMEWVTHTVTRVSEPSILPPAR